MRKLFVLIIVFSLFAPLSLAAAETVKLKHFGTLYVGRGEMGFNRPEGVACRNGFLVIADTGNKQLVRFKLEGQALSPENVIPLPETSPREVQLDTQGNIYVLDAKTRRVLKLTADGASQGALKIKGMVDDKLIPKSFRIDNQGNLYLLDIFSNRVVIAGPDQAFIRQIRFPEKFGFFSDLAVNGQGDIFLLDGVKADVYVAAAGSDKFTRLTQGLKEFINYPTNISLDERGIIYLSDQNGSGLVLIGKDGSFLGRKLTAGWDEGQLEYPAQTCINGQDQLFIADRDNSRVQMFSILAE